MSRLYAIDRDESISTRLNQMRKWISYTILTLFSDLIYDQSLNSSIGFGRNLPTIISNTSIKYIFLFSKQIFKLSGI